MDKKTSTIIWSILILILIALIVFDIMTWQNVLRSVIIGLLSGLFVQIIKNRFFKDSKVEKNKNSED